MPESRWEAAGLLDLAVFYLLTLWIHVLSQASDLLSKSAFEKISWLTTSKRGESKLLFLHAKVCRCLERSNVESLSCCRERVRSRRTKWDCSLAFEGLSQQTEKSLSSVACKNLTITRSLSFAAWYWPQKYHRVICNFLISEWKLSGRAQVIAQMWAPSCKCSKCFVKLLLRK